MALKSMPLNQTIKDDALHGFFVAATREARVKLDKMEFDLANKIYNLIYGPHKRKMANLPDTLFEQHGNIPMRCVHVKYKKAKRVKGKIEPTKGETFFWYRFCDGVSVKNCNPTRSSDSIRFGDVVTLPCAPAQQVKRYNNEHLDIMVNRGFITKATKSVIEAEYVGACKRAKEIYEPIQQAVLDVALILATCKTTKGLRDAWPECEEFLTLPQQTAGPLMALDVPALTANLHKMGIKRKQEQASA